jgi:SpoVK/Ycf46/Vps4 family AAA+-type ATPase
LLFDKWVGETEKYLEALFSLARKIQPTIVFIDEIDSLTRRRSDLDSGWNATMKSQFLSLWDGLLTDKGSQVVVLGATNRRQDIDEAFMRRMPLQIKLDLPNSAQRAEILRVLLSDVQVDVSLSCVRLANKMDRFSGSDIREVCRRVVMEASFRLTPETISESDFEPVLDRYRAEKRHDSNPLSSYLSLD